MNYSKIILVLFFNFLIYSTGFGQSSTIFSKYNLEYQGFFGGRTIQIHNIDGKELTTGGAEVGFSFSKLLIGGYLNATVVEFDVFVENAEISLVHGGVMLGYTSDSNKFIHLLGKLRVGSGRSSLVAGTPLSGESDKFVFLAIPEIGIELNIYKHLKIGLLLSYQRVSSWNDGVRLDGSKLSGFGGGIYLRFGIFQKD